MLISHTWFNVYTKCETVNLCWKKCSDTTFSYKILRVKELKKIGESKWIENKILYNNNVTRKRHYEINFVNCDIIRGQFCSQFLYTTVWWCKYLSVAFCLVVEIKANSQFYQFRVLLSSSNFLQQSVQWKTCFSEIKPEIIISNFSSKFWTNYFSLKKDWKNLTSLRADSTRFSSKPFPLGHSTPITCEKQKLCINHYRDQWIIKWTNPMIKQIDFFFIRDSLWLLK